MKIEKSKKKKKRKIRFGKEEFQKVNTFVFLWGSRLALLSSRYCFGGFQHPRCVAVVTSFMSVKRGKKMIRCVCVCVVQWFWIQ